MLCPICPTHNAEMHPVHTQWGVRMVCFVEDCTVACWPGKTSTPADDETRKLRQECHRKFDEMFKSGIVKRDRAYVWLAAFMDLPRERAHIGMFDVDQCRRLLEAL